MNSNFTRYNDLIPAKESDLSVTSLTGGETVESDPIRALNNALEEAKSCMELCGYTEPELDSEPKSNPPTFTV